MSTSNNTTDNIRVAGVSVHIQRKAIKNLHLVVLPPDGKVRVSVPQHVTSDAVRLAVVDKLGWIKRQQETFREQARQSERRYVSGETHYLFGRAYRLRVEETNSTQTAAVTARNRIDLAVRECSDIPSRARTMDRWYRTELKKRIPELLEKWEPRVGKQSSSWGVKKMKTKWGSCNTDSGSIWINLELAKKPAECLEYILVHELVHLHERTHNNSFRKWMDELLPDWPQRRALLNSSPLAHEDWAY